MNAWLRQMVHKDGRPQRVALAYALATLAGLSFLWVTLGNLVEERFAVFEHQQVAAYVDTLSASLVVALNEKISLITGLHAYVKAEIDGRGNLVNTETEAFAAELYHSSQDIRNIAIGPGGVMQFVYPYAANQSVVGYEPAQDPRPAVRAEVQRAIDSRDVVLSLPYALIQGGLGVIARRAVYVQDNYWGLVNIVVDVPALLKEAGLEPPPAGLALALRDQSGQVFWGDEGVLAGAPATHRIPLSEGAWELAAIPVQGWQSRYRGGLWFYRILGLLIVGILPLTVYLSINRRERMKMLVARRTQELDAAVQQLQEQMAARARAQEALQKNQANLSALIENTDGSIWSVDRDCRLIVGNSVFQRSIRAAYGRPMAAGDSVLADDLDRAVWNEWRRYYERALGGERFSVQTQRRFVDTSRTMEYHLNPIHAGDGSVLGVTVFGRDISARVKTEATLQKVAREWQTTFDSVTDALCLIDPRQRIMRTNQAMDDLFPDHRGAMAGRHCWEIVHGTQKPIAGCPLVHMRQTLQQESMECPLGARIFEITVDPILDDNGRLSGAVHVMRDITGRKADEKRLQEYTERLETMVAERTAGLETALAEMESFSYSVAHDLRSPLRGIDGWSLALLEDYGDRLDDQAHRYLDQVRTQAQHMGELIDDLLSLARVSRVEMQRHTVDLTALARSIAARLRAEQPQRPVEWIIQEGLTAQGDAALLQIALTNLLGNAWKFSRGRDPARIEFGQSEVEGQPVYFVRDNGVGFDMAHASKLFGAFQRLHSASEFPGTGIGLTTVQRIVHRHGGRVWAEARVGQGATFCFTLQVEA